MKSLDDIKDQYITACRSTTPERMQEFAKLAQLTDDFARMILYDNRRNDFSEHKHGYAMLTHNGINAYLVAGRFSKAMSEGKYFKHSEKAREGELYSLAEMLETINRNDKVAVDNYLEVVKLFEQLIELSQKGTE